MWPDIDADPSDHGDDDDEYEQPLRKITCRHCRKPGFTFVQLGNRKWMLQDSNGVLHTCVRDKRKEQMLEHSKERAQAFHEISVVFNGENPSIDDINRMLQDAARSDRYDKYFGSGR
jgi:hypothetical protein